MSSLIETPVSTDSGIPNTGVCEPFYDTLDGRTSMYGTAGGPDRARRRHGR